MANPQPEDGFIRIANELYEAMIRQKMSDSEWRVFLWLIRKIYGWRKTRDVIAYSQICEGTSLSRRRVIQAIAGLKAKRMILVTETSPVKPNLYEIQKDFDKWQLVTKTSLVTKKAQTSDKNVTKTSDKNVTHNRQGQTITTNNPPSPPKTKIANDSQKEEFPEGLNVSAWKDYTQYRRENRLRKLKPASAIRLQTWLTEQGPDDHQAAIVAQSIRNGWTGLFELKQNRGNGNGTDQQIPANESRAERFARKCREFAHQDKPKPPH